MKSQKIHYLSHVLNIAGDYPDFILELIQEILELLSDDNLSNIKELYKSNKRIEFLTLCKSIENGVINFKMDNIIKALRNLQYTKCLSEEVLDTEIFQIMREKKAFINEVEYYRKFILNQF